MSYTERRYGSFVRSIPVPEGISPEQVSASFENGVLEISIAVPESPRRKIAIRSPGETARTSSSGQASAASTAQRGAEGASEATPSPAARAQPSNGGNQPRS